MSIIIHSFNEGENIPQMSAQLSNNAFLKDIGYWRESCLAGCKLLIGIKLILLYKWNFQLLFWCFR